MRTVVEVGLVEECRVERKMRFDGGGQDRRGQEGRMSLRHSRGRGWTGVDKVKYGGGCWSYLGGCLVGGDVVRRQAGGTTEVSREGSRGDKVVVVVNLVDHGRQGLDILGARVGVITRGAVGQGWERWTNQRACWRNVVARVKYPGRFRAGRQRFQAW